jgi:aminoglycoside 3-N-acetyltransferase
MIFYHNITGALKTIGLRRDIPIIVHMDHSIFGKIKGGTATLMGALLSTIDNVMIPAFTFSTMVTPEEGPENNYLQYGGSSKKNLDAKIFSHTLLSELSNQEAIDILQEFPGTFRSRHPVFSFYGLGLDTVLVDHAPDKPYLPIKKLMDLGGWVLLIGVDPSQNFSIHYAEFLAGRKQFLRWALTPDGISACPHFPGCPDGFHKLDFYLQDELRIVMVEDTKFCAVPIKTLISTAVALLKEDTFALLCNNLQCMRCNLVRAEIRKLITSNWEPESEIF